MSHDRILLHRRRRNNLVALGVERKEFELVRLSLNDYVLKGRCLLRSSVAELLSLRGPEHGNFREGDTFAGGDVLSDGAAVVLEAGKGKKGQFEDERRCDLSARG
jgi:hypothetical protein